MQSQNTAEAASAVADLQEQWHQLNDDLDRARAIHKIHQAGVSLRQLAKALKCSLTRLRNLNLAAQAPLPDQILARKGEFSTRELVRRSRAAAARRANKEREEHERESVNAAQSVCRAICDWLKREGYSGGAGEVVIDEARWMLASAEATNELPRVSPPGSGTPIEQIIERMRPPWPAEDRRIPWIHRADPLHWYAQWLERWVFFALPDSITRHKALNLALDKQIRQ